MIEGKGKIKKVIRERGFGIIEDFNI